MGLALAGHLAAGTGVFELHVREAVVAVEYERGGKLISISTNDADNWRVDGPVIRQVKLGRGRVGMEFDGGFMGSPGRPDCAKILVPWSSQQQQSAKFVLSGNSRLIIDHWCPRDLEIILGDNAQADLHEVHVNGHLRLECNGADSIRGELLSCRSFDCGQAAGVKVKQFLATSRRRDLAGKPMTLRFDLPEADRC